MLKHVKLEKVLTLDIETVPMTGKYDQLGDPFKKLWDKKAKYIAQNPDDTPEKLFPRAGIYAEFGKVICISFGIFKPIKGSRDKTNHYQFRVKSFSGHEERKTLIHFIQLLNEYFNNTQYFLCAHNGKEFDFPYLSRRMMVHGFQLPTLLDNSGKKPWETPYLLDTMQMWKFGDYKHFTSLDLLTALFGIPTPKNDITGEDIYRVYYEEDNLKRIQEYCQKDVIATARLLMKLKGLPLLHDQNIVEVDEEE